MVSPVLDFFWPPGGVLSYENAWTYQEKGVPNLFKW